jgi:predicted dehydrogenase
LIGKTDIAVIGLGGIAQIVHLPILTKLNMVNLKAVAEVNKNRLNTIAAKYDIKHKYTDYNELLEKEKINAVIISTPTNTHHQIAIDCLNAGKDILIEKPAAISLTQIQEIIDTAKKNKRKVMVGMNLRFKPDAMLLKSIVKSGELGNPFYVRCGWIRKKSSKRDWIMQKEYSGGGVIADLGIVLLDLAVWLLDFPEIKSVSVQTYSNETKEVEDSAVGLIRLNNSSVINFEISWSFHSEKDNFYLDVFGTQGTAHLNPLKAYKKIDGSKIDYAFDVQSKNLKNLFKKSYENELKHFIGSVRNNVKLTSSIEEAMQRTILLKGIYKSAQLGKEIQL